MLKAPVVTSTKGKRIKHSADRKSMMRNFLTGTKFEGTWSDSLRCMEGLGEYFYPDGTVYRGNFEKGRFHGRGTIRLPKPYACTFRGEFDYGTLTVIEDMWFEDGLHIDAEIISNAIDFSRWTYCSSTDRRFMHEHLKGLPPVGPLANISATKPTRELDNSTYDLEGGIFNWDTGVVKFRPPPFHPMHIVCCPGYRSWIYEECRHSKSRPVNVTAQRCQNIIKNNLEAERDVGDFEANCNFDQDLFRIQYFSDSCRKVCAKEWYAASDPEDQTTVESELSSCDIIFSDTSSTSSFFESTESEFMSVEETDGHEPQSAGHK